MLWVGYLMLKIANRRSRGALQQAASPPVEAPLKLNISHRKKLMDEYIHQLSDSELMLHHVDTGHHFINSDKFLPIPWAAIGIEMGKGALAYLGGRIFQSIFFPNGGQQHIDFSPLITTLVAEIKGVLHEQIDQNELRILNASIEGIQQNIIHYMNNPQGVDRLEESTTDIANIVAQLKSLKKSGFPSYSIALNMQILITQERAKLYGNTENNNIIEIISRAESHLDDMYDQWSKWNDSKYTNPRRKGTGVNATYLYEFEGQTKSFNIAQLRKWFADNDLPLRDDIVNYDGVFSMHLDISKVSTWKNATSKQVTPITDDMWQQWKALRRILQNT